MHTQPSQSPIFQGEGYFYISPMHTQSNGTPTHEFLHFGLDGNVYGIEIQFSRGGIDQVVERFDTIPGNILLSGKYLIQGAAIRFCLASPQVDVEYKGHISGDCLYLNIHSRKNDYQSSEAYCLIATRPKHLENIAQNTIPRPETSPFKNEPGPTSVQLAKKAWEYDKHGDALNAIRHFDQAIQIDPTMPNLYYGRGVVYCKTQNYTMAIADLNRAIVLYPRFPGALTERGLAFLESGNLDRALKDYDEAIQINSQYAPAHINLGSLYAKQGRWKQALDELNEGIRLEPSGDEVAYINRATVYEQLGDIAAALSGLNKYLQVFPQGHHVEHVRKSIAALSRK